MNSTGTSLPSFRSAATVLALAGILFLLAAGALQAKTYVHTSFAQEDANDDWNNDGTPDGTDRFGGTPDDGVLRWPVGTHTLQWSVYTIPEGAKLTIASGSTLQQVFFSLGASAEIRGSSLTWTGGGVGIDGRGCHIDFGGCTLSGVYMVGGAWDPNLWQNVPGGHLHLHSCTFDSTGIERGKFLAGVWESISLESSTVWVQGVTLSSSGPIDIQDCTIYVNNPYRGWQYTFSEQDAITFDGYRSLSITHTRFQGTSSGVAVVFSIPDSSFSTEVNHSAFVSAPVAVRASNEALQGSDFTWNYWGSGDGPYFWIWNEDGYTYEIKREWADAGPNFVVVYTTPDPFFPFPYDPYVSVDGTDENADVDHDGLDTPLENDIGTNPFNPDTDGDGIPDGVEVAWSTDPLDPNDPGVEPEEPTPQDSTLYAQGQSEALDALDAATADSLRQQLADPRLTPQERQQLLAQTFHDYTGNATVDQIREMAWNDLRLVGQILAKQWNNLDSLINNVLETYFLQNYNQAEVERIVNSNLPASSPPPDTLNGLIKRRTGQDPNATLVLEDTTGLESRYQTPDGRKKAYFLHRDDVVEKPTLIGETEKGIINGLEGVGKLAEKVDKTGFITKIYDAGLISGVLKAGIRNVNRYLTHDGANLVPRKENLVYVKDPPAARLPIPASKEVITIKGVGQVSLVYEADDGRKFIKVDGKAFNKDATNWSWWRRSWTSKFVGGIPYQLIPLKCVDASKGIYEVDDSAIPDAVKNPLLAKHVPFPLTTTFGDTLEPLFALVDPDSDSVAEVIELDADRDGRFDTFLLSTVCDSCGYNVAKVDTNSDGTIDLVFTDLTGDGFPDAVDLNLDGRNDAFDTNGDGFFDRIDYDGDGQFDAYDLNLNGRLDLYLIPTGGFTNVQGSGSTNLPRKFSVSQNYPNPVHAGQATTLRYALPKATRVRVEIYNVLGQRVATLLDKQQAAGWHEISWSPRSASPPLPSGVYFLRVLAGKQNQYQSVRKLLIQR